MAEYLIQDTTLTGIADAIRGKTGGTVPVPVSDMAAQIEGIQAGGGDIDALIDRSITEISSDVTSVGEYAFYKCSKLTTANFPVAMSIGSNAFRSCSSLTTLILRSETTATLSNTNALGSTLIASGTGYIYVPRALIEGYKVVSNWSTYAAQFRALEDYTVDGTITGELDPAKTGT